MEQKNRIALILQIPNSWPDRCDACSSLEYRIDRNEEPKLSEEEITLLISSIPEAVSRLSEEASCAYWLCRLLFCTTLPHPAVKTYALKRLKKIGTPVGRALALYYLWKNYISEMPKIYETFKDDPEPGVQEQLAYYVNTFDRDKAMDIWIRMINMPGLDHQVCESIEFQFRDEGSERELKILKEQLEAEKDDEKRGNLEHIINLLEAGLKKRSGS